MNAITAQPISVISYALDGVEKVRVLQSFDAAKNDENNKEVQESAKMVWELMIDSSRLLLRREQVLAARGKLVDTNIGQRWGSYLLKKVPFTTDFQQYHTLVRPQPYSQPSFMTENTNRPPHPKDAEYAGKDIKQLEIMRMSLAPRDNAGPTTATAATTVDVQRIQDLQNGGSLSANLQPQSGERQHVAYRGQNGVNIGQNPPQAITQNAVSLVYNHHRIIDSMFGRSHEFF
jgi:hypothetical protein